MRCINCRKRITSGQIWGVTKGSFSIVPNVKMNVFKRLFVFCDKICSDAFFLSDDRMSKNDCFRRRLKTRERVFAQWQEAILRTDNEDMKDLLYVLRKGCD
jgi:hypothetical protein